MPSFCGNCGSPNQANSAFCPQCGAPSASRPSPSQAPSPAPIVSTAKGSSALKIVLILVCCLFVVGAAIVGGVIYAAHRIQQKIVQTAADNGVDLGALSSRNSEERRRSLPKVCSLLTKEDVSKIIGEPIDRAEVKDQMCFYYGPAGLSAKLAQDQASGAFGRAQTPGSKVDASEVANAVDQLTNSIGAQSGNAGNNGELPLLMLGLDADGKAQMAAVSASKAIFGGIGKGAGGPGFGADITGLGDKALRVPKLGLNVLQGEILIRIIPGPFPESDEKTIAIARAVLPKI